MRQVTIRGIKWRIVYVDDVSEEMLRIGLGRADSWKGRFAGAVDVPGRRIVIARWLTDHERADALLHELLHVVAPRFTEATIRSIERHLAPVLWRGGWRVRRSSGKRE